MIFHSFQKLDICESTMYWLVLNKISYPNMPKKEQVLN